MKRKLSPLEKDLITLPRLMLSILLPAFSRDAYCLLQGWRHGSKADCEEAVHVAFLKMMGLSENLKLSKDEVIGPDAVILVF